MRPRSTDMASSTSYTGSSFSLKLCRYASKAASASASGTGYPSKTWLIFRCASRITTWGKAYEAASATASSASSTPLFCCKRPRNVSALTILSGSSSFTIAMTSPGLNVAPSLIWKCTEPASAALSDMYIFITSIST